MSRSYKFWYRMAQSMIQYYHTPKLQAEQKGPLLTTALSALTNALQCLDSHTVPCPDQLRNLCRFSALEEEDIEAIIMKMRTELLHFRHSTLTLIAYVSLGLGLWRKAIRVGQTLLEDKKFDGRNKINVLHYVLEAESQLGKNTQLLRDYLDQLQQQLCLELSSTQVVYVEGGGEEGEVEVSDY